MALPGGVKHCMASGQALRRMPRILRGDAPHIDCSAYLNEHRNCQSQQGFNISMELPLHAMPLTPLKVHEFVIHWQVSCDGWCFAEARPSLLRTAKALLSTVAVSTREQFRIPETKDGGTLTVDTFWHVFGIDLILICQHRKSQTCFLLFK